MNRRAVENALRYTRHAREVCARRSVSFADVVEVVADAHVVEPHEGRTRYTRGGLCAVVAEEEDALVLVTVLLRERADWTDTDCRERTVRSRAS